MMNTHIHHKIPKSRGGTDEEWNLVEMDPYTHAYEHALDFVLFEQSSQFDFRHEAWPLLPEDLKEAVLAEHKIRFQRYVNNGSPSAIKGLIRAHNLYTGEDGFFETVPKGFKKGIPVGKRNPGKPKEVSKKWVTEVCQWYTLGFTTRDIAAILDLTAPTINNILKKNNITLRPIGGKRGKDLKPRKTDGYSRKQNNLVH